jgi:signal transduction histidine kinase
MMDLAGPKKPEPVDVDVAALAREVVALASLSERSGSGDVAVHYRGPEGAAFARCDPAQMRQVLWNLVRNGVQATGAGTSVTVSVTSVGDRVEMAVRDEGPGIAPDAMQKIFDAFYTTRAGGAGIGLAVVRRIIEDHRSIGASIEVRDEAGPGATFVVGLARADGPAKRDENRDPGVAVPANAGSRS